MELTPGLIAALGMAAVALAGAGGWIVRGGARGSQSAQQRLEGISVAVGGDKARPECSTEVAAAIARHGETLAALARTVDRLAENAIRQTALMEHLDRQVEQDGWRFRAGRTAAGGREGGQL